MVDLQPHVLGVLSMRHVTPTSRLTSTGVSGVYANFMISPSFKIEKLILMLGSYKFFTVWPRTYHGWWMNMRIFKFPIDDANCKGTIWIQSPRMKRTKAQRATNNEFVESGLETEFQ